MTNFKSHSQYGEDYFTWKYFNQKSSGLIIEVGAFDGKYFSTSYSLEKKGWDCICIEANPETYKRLLKNRQNATCIPFALVADKMQKSTTFYTEPLGLYSGIMPNTDLKQVYHSKRKKLEINKIEVPTATLNKILEEQNINPDQIDCITIDVEGTEIDILKGLDINFYKPKLFIIEANKEIEQTTILEYMKTKEYSLIQKIGVNLIFANQQIQFSNITINLNHINPTFQIHPKGLDYSEQSSLFIQKRPKWNRFFQRFLRLKNIFKTPYKKPV